MVKSSNFLNTQIQCDVCLLFSSLYDMLLFLVWREAIESTFISLLINFFHFLPLRLYIQSSQSLEITHIIMLPHLFSYTSTSPYRQIDISCHYNPRERFQNISQS